MTLRSFIKVLGIIFILSVLYVAVKWGLFLIVDFGFPKEAKDIALREVVHPNYRYSKDTLFDTYHGEEFGLDHAANFPLRYPAAEGGENRLS